MDTDQSRGRYGMSASATAAYDALEGVNRPISLAIASLLGAAQGTAPADRWQHCADAIEDARRLLDQAAANLAQARPDQPAADEPAHSAGPGYGMSARANEAGRCVVCDGVTGVCQVCHQPRHDAEADHKLSLLPCRECNGGSYPVRRYADDREV